VTRRYGHPIQVQTYLGHPLSFVWRGTRYQISTILDTWHLQDRWWAREGSGGGSSDRAYYRLDCSGDLQCEIYFDAVISIWILDRVYD
jgi:Family of unknown function (DUF6504)